MATYEFKLPDLGEGVVEGELVKWLVKPGDTVTEDMTVAEVMTDKATVTVPSSKKGKVLALHGKEGEMVKVHQTLLTMELEGGAGGEAPAAAAHGAPAAQPASAGAVKDPVPAMAAASPTRNGDAKVLATPLTRRMAREHGLDLAAIPGSGPSGRVLKADVMAALEGGAKPAANQVVAQAPAQARGAGAPSISQALGDEAIPLKGLRKKIAEKMVRSKFTAPHFSFVEECDCTELVAMRKRLNEALAASGDGTKLTFLPFITKAVVAAMRKFPGLNANMDEGTQTLYVKKARNIGIAVSTDDGLTVPVVHDAAGKSLRELAQEIARLGTAAREKKLQMSELQGGTFTITSLGLSGGLFATPIINHPEVAILGIHKMKKRPVVIGDSITVREMMNVSISCDHRVVDGQTGADFVYEVIKYLEKPDLLFLAMA